MQTATAVDAAVSILEGRSDPAVLELLVDAALRVTGARYAAAILIGPDGTPSALASRDTDGSGLTVPGLSPPEGPVAVVLRGQTVRVPDLARHPQAVSSGATGQMASFVGVPLTVDGRVLGGLYLASGRTDGELGARDQLAAEALARQTAAVVDGLRRREATADLLYGLGTTSARTSDPPGADTDSPVIRRLLIAAREVLGMDLAFLSRLDEGGQTFTHVEPAPGSPPVALDEGTVVDATDGYCALMIDGRIPAAVPDIAGHPVLGAMAVTAHTGAGSYCGVPVRLPSGELYGTLCGLSARPSESPSNAQLEAMRTIAGLVGVRLQQEKQQARERQQRADAFAPMVDGERRSTVLQPIVDLHTGLPVGYEALSRFTDAWGAPQRPDNVFAEARELDLTMALERAAVTSALALLPALPTGAYLSVNVSPQALLDPLLLALLETELSAADAGRVVLELTEHEHVEDYPLLQRALAGLRARGIRLAIDDTGAGFASLQHVSRLQPDIIKLDIAFVRDVHLDPSRRAVARALISFAADIGAALVAEGIESADELTELIRLGAPFGQGYRLGRPLPPEQALLPHQEADPTPSEA